MGGLTVLLVLAGLVEAGWGALELDFGSTDLECQEMEHMFFHSVPQSCNHALGGLLASGRDLTRLTSLGDLCETYCLFPLSQAAQDCPRISQVYELIMAACCQGDRGHRCFDLAPLVMPLSLSCNLSSEVCSENCSLALSEVHTRLGCCFNTMFNTSGDILYPFAHTEVWEKCEQPSPGERCMWCSHTDSLGMTSTGLMTILVTSGLWMTL